MNEILMRESYPFLGTSLCGGARYRVGQMVGGHKLTEEHAARLIAEGWAEEVS